MDSVVISGICRCCSSEGPSKDLTSKYLWMGEEEIYEKMLQDCFSVSLSAPDDDRTFGGICEVCITQLRNAFNFKKQVILTEEMFKKKLISGFKPVKLEIGKDDGATDSEGDFGANDEDTDYEVPIKMEEEYLEEDSEVEKPKKRSAKAKASTSKAKKPKVEAESSKKRLQTDDQLICPECNQSFTTLFNIKRHLLRIHGVEAKLTRKMVCDLCGKVVFNSEFLARHLVLGCPVKKKECVKCNVWFHNKSEILEHMKQKHWSGPIQKMNCPLCDESFKSHEHHDMHLSQDHDIQLDFEELTFFCMEDLISWKEEVEQTVGVCLLKRTSSDGKQYYLCYPKKYLGLIRQPGRSKTCPARIEITEESECFYVTYQSVHVCDSSSKRKTKSQILCPICEIQLKSYEELNSHISSEHDVQIDEQELAFNSFQGAGSGAKTKRKGKKKKKTYESATPERTQHRVNLTSILRHSNASPFRDKTMRGFSCLYCAKYFKDIKDLRLHTAQQSEKDKLNSMIDYKLSYNPIKVDITDLHCNICDSPMKDLSDLKQHLVNVHSKTIHKGIKDIILPFRLLDGTNFACTVCGAAHVSFKNLYHHMSSHYSNYCCNKCGAGYITIAALRKHNKTHEDGNFQCSYCEKTYSSLSKKRNHEKGVHTGAGGWLRNKCPHCPDIFVSYYDRNEHLVKVHNQAPVTYSCNACNKIYKKKFELSRHVKHHHLQQRNYMCDCCNAKFFSKRGLIDHMSRHNGGETFTCDICGKNFSRQRTLKEHMRLHEDFTRYQCEICKRSFMQKCSLKSHMRLHQEDLDIFKEFDDVKHLIDNRDLTLKQIAAENKNKAMAEKANFIHNC